MMKSIVKIIVDLLGTKAVRDILIYCAERLAARTDNKFDDDAVAAVKEAARKVDAMQ